LEARIAKKSKKSGNLKRPLSTSRIIRTGCCSNFQIALQMRSDKKMCACLSVYMVCVSVCVCVWCTGMRAASTIEVLRI
jgi:hypothetical protein